MSSKKSMLVILDGWGHGENPSVSAIAQAKTPFVDGLYESSLHAELVTHGENVGLPKGQMGNSEVGHLNIGAGRVVFQDLMRINNAIEENTLADQDVLRDALAYAKSNNKPIHLLGLVSDGGVHSHINHLLALCDLCEQEGVPSTYIHAFTDGRDTSPQGGKTYLKQVTSHIEGTRTKIASVIGRYYAMDRDKRWERIKVAYDLLVKGQGHISPNILEYIESRYAIGETDEFLMPIIHEEYFKPIEEGDVVVFYNFRNDRPRQLTEALTQRNFEEQQMKKLPLYFVTMTLYDATFEDIRVVFKKDNLKNTLGEVLAQAGKSQVRIAETEKYPHVTFFFSGGREKAFEGESRIMIPSPKVATYDLAPAMSARGITTAICETIQSTTPDFICLNYANADMVGHTGDFQAAIQAAETVDKCLKELVEVALEKNYAIIVIADHGNSDVMINPDGSPHTAHTTNLVPIFYIDKNKKFTNLSNGKLADVAPTILKIMNITAPLEMTGEILLK